MVQRYYRIIMYPLICLLTGMSHNNFTVAQKYIPPSDNGYALYILFCLRGGRASRHRCNI